ncbi:thiol-disulfide oxidoreductase DCC family protein [Bacillus sp. NEB1478]|uniref:thiol-disulfide oxidoreductase DCC family protein n=1 Tax=Bacillus sp. NEB1478 TaxID=3073816 RepID=UPI002872C175|nr:thiol-disulfide oxidoreductase DCC family protein [Bacillus sp. NEB1478]WNB92398.1 thiol-disulfide oxidoreductase DCC family protein [Bacillus sp. NEB1478]
MKNVKKSHDLVLLFDGVCNLCNSSVQFILKHEKNEELKFAAIQSESGKELLSRYHIDTAQTDSVIFIENGKVYFMSDAVLTLTRYLRSPWNLSKNFLVFPRPLRDFLYKRIAKNRYRWFGKKESCMIPTPALRKRFLE